MGNKQDVPAADGDREVGWMVVDVLPENSISFNPQTSHVVCAGVAEQAGLEKKSNLGPAADRDAIGVAKLFYKKFKIPDDQISVLTSRTKPASDKAIISALKLKAKRVKDDGILVFQFSGHVHRVEKHDMIVFIPANFDGTGKTAITVQRLLKAISGTSAKYIVMIMDCCYAGGVAEELILNIPQDIPTYILASCTSTQKSLSFNELGNGFFTYFFLKYFEGYKKDRFPLKDVVNYCKPLCDAINKLLRPGFDHDACMSPQIHWNTYKIKVMSLKEKGEDVTDFGREIDPLDYARHYRERFLSKKKDNSSNSPWERLEIPELVLAWLHVSANDSLKYLYDMGLLRKYEKGLFSTIVAFVAQSVVGLMYREFRNTNNLSTMYKASALLEAFITFSEILYKTIDYNMCPDLVDLRLFIEYYAYKLKILTKSDYDNPEMLEIVMLLTKVLKDINKDTPVKVGERMHKGEDVTDGGPTEGEGQGVTDDSPQDDTPSKQEINMLGAYLDNLPLANSPVTLPEISNIEDELYESDEDESVELQEK